MPPQERTKSPIRSPEQKIQKIHDVIAPGASSSAGGGTFVPPFPKGTSASAAASTTEGAKQMINLMLKQNEMIEQIVNDKKYWNNRRNKTKR